MTRKAHVHPMLARQLATHIAKHVWDGQQLRQVHPGIFTHPDGRVLVIMGAAPISEPAVTALRRSGLLWELVALMDASRQEHSFYGPRHQLGEEEWCETLSACLSATKDVQTVCSRFEVMVAAEASKLACLGEASAMVAAQLPQVPEAAERRQLIKNGGWDFLEHLEDEVTRAVEAAA